MDPSISIQTFSVSGPKKTMKFSFWFCLPAKHVSLWSVIIWKSAFCINIAIPQIGPTNKSVFGRLSANSKKKKMLIHQVCVKTKWFVPDSPGFFFIILFQENEKFYHKVVKKNNSMHTLVHWFTHKRRRKFVALSLFCLHTRSIN